MTCGRATPPARAPGSRCSTGPRAPRSKRSCAGSRRWRRPSSRGSRSTSSTRWRSRTTSTPTRGSRARSGCPARRTASNERPTRGRRREEESRMSETRGRRGGGRAARQAASAARASSRACRSSPARCAVRGPLRGGAVELIEENADTILEQVGIDFRERPTRSSSSAAQARRSTASGCASRAACAASSCRRPRRASSRRSRATRERSVVFGGRNTIFAPAYGSPFVRDLDGGRRYGTIEDFRNFVKLAYVSPWLHHSGGTVCEPVDLPVNKRHYDMVYGAPAATRTSRSWARSRTRSARGTPSRWRGSCSARTSWSRTRSSSA